MKNKLENIIKSLIEQRVEYLFSITPVSDKDATVIYNDNLISNAEAVLNQLKEMKMENYERTILLVARAIGKEYRYGDMGGYPEGMNPHHRRRVLNMAKAAVNAVWVPYNVSPALLSACERQVQNIDRWLETGIPADEAESRSIYEQMKSAINNANGVKQIAPPNRT